LAEDEAQAATQAFSAARQHAGGVQFLAVQSGESQAGFDGFWLMRDLPDA